jgi:hypothetical protein
MPTERAEVLGATETDQWLALLWTELQAVVGLLVVPAIVVIAGVRTPVRASGVQDEAFTARVPLHPKCQPQSRVILNGDRVAIVTRWGRIGGHVPHVVRQHSGSPAFVVTPQNVIDARG